MNIKWIPNLNCTMYTIKMENIYIYITFTRIKNNVFILNLEQASHQYEANGELYFKLVMKR